MPSPRLELVACRAFRHADARGGDAWCGLRVYRAPRRDRPDVVIVTELPWNPGVPAHRVAGRLRGNVCALLDLDPDCVRWIEHEPPGPAGVPPASRRERFVAVEFGDAGADDARHELAREHVERLVGGPLGDPPFLAEPAPAEKEN